MSAHDDNAAADRDPMNMFVRAGWLAGIALREETNAETRLMLERASRSLEWAAKRLLDLDTEGRAR